MSRNRIKALAWRAAGRAVQGMAQRHLPGPPFGLPPGQIDGDDLPLAAQEFMAQGFSESSAMHLAQVLERGARDLCDAFVEAFEAEIWAVPPQPRLNSVGPLRVVDSPAELRAVGHVPVMELLMPVVEHAMDRVVRTTLDDLPCQR